MDLSVERIEEAARVIDPVFRDSPQFVHDQLTEVLGRRVLVKVETLNPLRSFKGRPGSRWDVDALVDPACSALVHQATVLGRYAVGVAPGSVRPCQTSPRQGTEGREGTAGAGWGGTTSSRNSAVSICP